MNNNQIFLENFLKLENYLKDNIAEFKDQTIGSIIYNVKHSGCKTDIRIEKFIDDIDLARNIRNIFVHEGSVVTVDDVYLDSFIKLVNLFTAPQIISNKMIPLERIISTDLNETLKSVFNKMIKYGVSNVPILTNGIVKGVISEKFPFYYFKTNKKILDNFDLKVSDVLNVIQENKKYYSYSLSTDSIPETIKKFTNFKQKIDLVFITSNGTEQSSLKGLITLNKLVEGLI